MHCESRLRSLLKAVSWRCMATAATVLIAYAVFGEFDKAAAVGGIEVLAKFVLYFLHERVWNLNNIGKFPMSATVKNRKAFVLWFTGLPCSGKTSLAKRMAAELAAEKQAVEHLDGDIVREAFPRTGFSQEERNTHIRQMGFWAGKLEKHGVCVVASFVSPFRESREFARRQCANFVEIHVATPLEECERRDVKGMYRKARAGEIRGFTGVDDPYETPESAEVTIDTSNRSIEECIGELRRRLGSLGLLPEHKNVESKQSEESCVIPDGSPVAARK